MSQTFNLETQDVVKGFNSMRSSNYYLSFYTFLD